MKYKVSKKAPVYSKKNGMTYKNIVIQRDMITLQEAIKKAEEDANKTLFFRKEDGSKVYKASCRGLLSIVNYSIFETK